MTLRNCYNMTRKPEPNARKLTESWARIYKAVLEANNLEIDLATQAHIEIFNVELHESVDEWLERIVKQAMIMKMDELEALYAKCRDFRASRESLRNLKGAA